MKGPAEHSPRVLIVASEAIEGTSGTAVTLTNLFGGWGDGALGQVIATAIPAGLTPRWPTYVMPRRSAPVDHYPRSLLRAMRGGDRTNGNPAEQQIAASPASRSRRSLAGGLHAQARAIADMSPIVVPNDLRDWVLSFRPEVVYSLLGSVRIMRLARVVGKLSGVPVIPHFMDDWPATLYSSGEIGGIARVVMRRELSTLLRDAPTALTVSDAMAEEYTTRFGRSFRTFANPVDVHLAPSAPRAGGDELRLMYVGGLHLERWKVLRNLGRQLDVINMGAPSWFLVIHAPATDLSRYASAFEGLASVQVGGSLAPDRVGAKLRDADVLLHVESFDPEIRRHTRLSLSTKIPQYFAANRPVLAIGPGDVASISLVASSGAGLVVSSDSGEGLRSALEVLARPDARSLMARHGVELATERFSRTVVRQELKDLLDATRGGHIPTPTDEAPPRTP